MVVVLDRMPEPARTVAAVLDRMPEEARMPEAGCLQVAGLPRNHRKLVVA